MVVESDQIVIRRADESGAPASPDGDGDGAPG
ncbi:MAG: hypothetical protein AVDCRST_MAG17-593, partial [uncultured Solirubrobacterales bacterium]